MTLEQIIVLAIVQGVTEFLLISSSGHLILIPRLMHWPDQGQLTDVLTHLGTLLAILIYFWRDVWHITRGALELFKGKVTEEGKLAIYIVLATIPAVAFGIVLKKFGYADLERNVAVVAWNTNLYGILMLIADMVVPAGAYHPEHDAWVRIAPRRGASARLDPGHQSLRRDHDGRQVLGVYPAGLRALLVPARHSAMAGAIVFSIGDALESGGKVTQDQLLCAALAFVAGILAIAFLINLLKRISFLPFVLYRMVLGGFLLVLLYS